jgi:hypothetical protein
MGAPLGNRNAAGSRKGGRSAKKTRKKTTTSHKKVRKTPFGQKPQSTWGRKARMKRAEKERNYWKQFDPPPSW